MAEGKFHSVILVLGALLGTGAGAQESAPPDTPALRKFLESGREALKNQAFGLDVSAFADGVTSLDEEGHRHFRFGSGEVDLGLELGSLFELSGAWVASSEERVWAAYALDFNPFGGGTIAPRGSLPIEKGFHIQLGRIDAPFGSDFAYFASKDSVSIGRPLTTEILMDGGYNDRGLRLFGNNGTFNFNAYVLRGLAEGEGRVYGARLGFTPFEAPFTLKEGRDPKLSEWGLSFFMHRAPGGRQTERGFALDGDLHLRQSCTRFEYLIRQSRPLDLEAVTRRGWHLTQEYSLGEELPTLFARLDRIWGPASLPDRENPAGPGDPTSRISAGLRATLWATFQAKLEWQRFRRVNPAIEGDGAFSGTRWSFQVVWVL